MKWVKHQLTEEQAKAIFESRIWLKCTPEQVVRFQLFQKRFFVDIEYFLGCLKKVVGFSHINYAISREYRKEAGTYYLFNHTHPTVDEARELLGDKAYLAGL